MPAESLLTRLEITPYGELYAQFRNLGGIHFPWNHLYPTKVLGKHSGLERDKSLARLKAIQRRVKADPSVQGFPDRVKKKHWLTYQIYGPVGLKDVLPHEFLRGKLTFQARRRLTPPGWLVHLDDSALQGLTHQREIGGRLADLESRVRQDKDSRTGTLHWNDLDHAFDAYDGDNLKDVEQSRGISRLNQDIVMERRSIAHNIIEANQQIGPGYELRYEVMGSGREHKLRLLGNDFSFLKHGRLPDPDYYYKGGILSLDIEIGKWQYPDAKISQIGYYLFKESLEDDVKAAILAIAGFEIPPVQGIPVYTFPDEDGEMKKAAEIVRQDNPIALAAWNHKFDLVHMRETKAGYPIGNPTSQPLFKVTTPFFERVSVHDRIILDPMYWHRTAYSFKPNHKLVMAGDKMEGISYDDLERLQSIIDGDLKHEELDAEDSLKAVANYLAGDITALPKIMLSKEFKNNMHDLFEVCRMYKLSPERLLHSPNAINEVQEDLYFKEVGTYRESIDPHRPDTKTQKREGHARERFKRSIIERHFRKKRQPERHEHVHLAAIPIGDFFREAMQKMFPDAALLFEYKDKHRDDKQRLFFLDQYAKAMSRWMITDYGRYHVEEGKLERMLKGTDQEEFENHYHRLCHAMYSVPGLRWRIEKASIRLRDIEDWTDDAASAWLAKESIEKKRWWHLVNQRINVKRFARNFLGNYDVFPSRKRFTPEKYRQPEQILVMDEIIQEHLSAIDGFLDENDLEVLHSQGYFLYLSGPEQALKREDAPVVWVDELDEAWIADMPHYLEKGFFSHIALKDKPSNLFCMHEMNTYSIALTDLIQGRLLDAQSRFRDARERLERGDVPLDELLFHNKSRKWHSVFVKNSDSSDGRIYFVRDDSGINLPLSVDAAGQKYFSIRYKEKMTRLYVDPEIIPDYQAYVRRMEKKADELGVFCSPQSTLKL